MHLQEKDVFAVVQNNEWSSANRSGLARVVRGLLDGDDNRWVVISKIRVIEAIS